LDSLIPVKDGLSMICSRMYIPTATSTPLARNATLQPQERKASSGMTRESTLKAAVPSNSPAPTPNCGQLPKKPLLL